MPRYVHQDRWFTIEVDGACLRIEDPDEARTESYDDEEAAEEAYDDVVLRALDEGYRLVAEEEPPRAALERQILINPDDVDAHLVYADLLQTEGDPRGELIALHAEVLRRPEDPEVVAQAKRLRKQHREHFYGGFEELEEHLELTWRLGFIRSAVLRPEPRYGYEPRLDDEEESSTEALAALLADFLAHPSARFLRDLTVREVWSDVDDEAVLDPIVRAIAETEGPYDALRTLSLEKEDETYASWEITNADPLFLDLPALESLAIRAEFLSVGELGDPRLRHLRLEHCVTSGVLRAIARTTWTELIELDLDLSRAANSPSDLAALFSSPERVPRLRRLRLRGANHTDELADLLLESRMIDGLEVLDLSGGSMSDDVARTFASRAGVFARMKRLDVSGNMMTRDGYDALRSLPCKVVFGEQVQAEDRYDGIQE